MDLKGTCVGGIGVEEFDASVVYEAEVAPLVARLFEVCAANNIPLVVGVCPKREGEITEVISTVVMASPERAPLVFGGVIAGFEKGIDGMSQFIGHVTLLQVLEEAGARRREVAEGGTNGVPASVH